MRETVARSDAFDDLAPVGDPICVEAVLQAYTGAPPHLAFSAAIQEWEKHHPDKRRSFAALAVAKIICNKEIKGARPDVL